MKKLFLFALVLGLVSCLESIDQTILVSSVTVSPENRNLRVGDTADLTAIVAPTNASDKSVAWSSSSPTIVSVDAATGHVKALAMGSGTVTITATATNGKTDNCLITVVPTPVTSVSIGGTAPTTFKVGDTFELTASVLPLDATDKTISWVASPTGYLELTPVSGGAKVTVKAIKYTGSTAVTIRASSNSDSGVYKELGNVKVGATAVESIAVVENGIIPSPLQKGATFFLKANFTPSTSTNTEVTWVSSDVMIATIDANGKVTIMGVGDVRFTATLRPTIAGIDATPYKSAVSTTYTAVRVAATSVVISGGDRQLAVGGSYSLQTTVAPSNTTDTVVWSSNNIAVATVDASTGVVRGVVNGVATITATAGTVSGSITVTVGTGISTP